MNYYRRSSICNSMVAPRREDGPRLVVSYTAYRRGSLTNISAPCRPASSTTGSGPKAPSSGRRKTYHRQMSLPDRLPNNDNPIQFRLVQRRMRRISLPDEYIPSHDQVKFVDPTQKDNVGLKRRNRDHKACQGNARWTNSCSSSMSSGSCSSAHRCESVDGDASSCCSNDSDPVIQLPPVTHNNNNCIIRRGLDRSPSCASQAPKRPQRKYSEDSDTLDAYGPDGIGRGIPKWIIIDHATNTVSIEMGVVGSTHHSSSDLPLISEHPSLSDSNHSRKQDAVPPKMPRRASQEGMLSGGGHMYHTASACHHPSLPIPDCPILEKKSLLADFFEVAGDDILDDLSNRSFRDWDEEDNLDESCWGKSTGTSTDTTTTVSGTGRRRSGSIDSQAVGSVRTGRMTGSMDSDLADRIIESILDRAKDQNSAAKKVMASYWDWIAAGGPEQDPTNPPGLSCCETNGPASTTAVSHKKREQLLYGY